MFATICKAKSIGFRIDFHDAFLSIVGPLQQRHTDGGLPLTSGLPLASGSGTPHSYHDAPTGTLGLPQCRPAPRNDSGINFCHSAGSHLRFSETKRFRIDSRVFGEFGIKNVFQSLRMVTRGGKYSDVDFP